MKTFNISFVLAVVLYILCTTLSYAQDELIMQLRDKEVASQKAKLLELQKHQSQLKATQAQLIKELADREKRFAVKKKTEKATLMDKSTTEIYTDMLVRDSQGTINDTKDEMAKIKKLKSSIQHGFRKVKRDITIEQRYLDEINDDYKILNDLVSTSAVGGNGYYKAALIKIMLRAMEVNRRIYSAYNEIRLMKVQNNYYFK